MNRGPSIPEDFWPTFMEAWPDGLTRLAIPASEIPLDQDDMYAIVSATPSIAREMGIEKIFTVSRRLVAKTTTVLSGSGPPMVPRLGACSWKSSLHPRPLASNVARLVGILRMPHLRVATMLRAHLATGRLANLYLRPLLDLPPWSETRVFVRNGRVVGASQYASQTIFFSSEAAEEHALRLAQFLTRLVPAMHVPDVVADIGFNAETEAYVLIDLNPFHPRSEPCLFSWSRQDFDGSFRYCGSAGIGLITAERWLFDNVCLTSSR